MLFYQYAKCSTCKKALNFLKQLQIPFQIKEITTEPPDLEKLEKMLKFQEGKIKKLFNTSGLLYKELNLSKKLDSMTAKEALTLLSKNGMLIKRPFLLADQFGLTGFNELDWSKKLQ